MAKRVVFENRQMKVEIDENEILTIKEKGGPLRRAMIEVNVSTDSGLYITAMDCEWIPRNVRGQPGVVVQSKT